MPAKSVASDTGRSDAHQPRRLGAPTTKSVAGISAAFTPDYQPEEIYEIASKLYKASKR